MPPLYILHNENLPRAYKQSLAKQIPEAVFFPFKDEDISSTNKVYDSILLHPCFFLPPLLPMYSHKTANS